jgi:glycyl-tRNA synthetase
MSDTVDTPKPASAAPSQDRKADAALMEKIVSLCKRRGLVFQSSEIYGGLNGAWDYGPLGAELKKNVKDYWWRKMTRERDDIVGMDGAILMNRKVWQASGHEATFSDPMVDCKGCKGRFRADQIGALLGEAGWPASFEKQLAKDPSVQGKEVWMQNTGKKSAPNLPIASFNTVEEFHAAKAATKVCPTCGGELTEPREFNLMLKTNIGAIESEDAKTYLRPETAQAIFVQFKNVLDTSRKKLPFGIAQIGKAFRNEINPRNYTFRSREFEQMELEYFCHPKDGMQLTDYWLEERLKFYEEIGLPREKLHVYDVPDGERAFYSLKTYDIEFAFPFGVQELEGVAYRTDYDLSAHIKHSGKPLDYFDDETRERFVPHVVEPSAGVDRTVLAVICNAYDEEEVKDEKGNAETRTVLRFHPRVAPVKVAVFPLLKKNEEQVRVAREIVKSLRTWMNVSYDETGAIGRRYRRQDEVGTPFCVTVDFDTIGENGEELKGTVTMRDRDSMEQVRLPIGELRDWLLAKVM